MIKGGAILGSSGHVVIGDNVFIGMNTIITRNAKVGNNVIIGVGSVVQKIAKIMAYMIVFQQSE